jgi:serine/threonine-protein kinase
MDTKVADNLIGTLVDGRYRVRGRVARGGMATVYTAVDERLERTVALKMIHPGQADDPRFVDRFTREAKTIARLTHPNVVAVYDQGTHRGLPYLVMEYVRGRTLRDMLTDSRRLGAGEALAVLEQMLAAIAAAHRAGVVHRDIKPENVLIAEAPGGTSLIDAVVKVADFGLARAVEASAEDGDGQLLATVAYVAPELVTDGFADPRSDVYSVGIVLFEMLTGRVPYDGGKPIEVAWCHVDQDVPPPSKYVPDLEPELDALVARATSRDPNGRPTDAGTMLSEVQVAHDQMEAAASLRGRTLLAPTVIVDTVPPARAGSHAAAAAAADDRPSWSRLPGSTPASDDRPMPGRRRAAGRTTSPARGAEVESSGPTPIDRATQWFAAVMARPNGRRTFYATLVVLALVVSLTGWWFGSGRYTSAPEFVGQTQTQAVAAAQHGGFKLAYADPIFSETIPKNTVVKQTPAASGRLVRGGAIQLTLSKGPERYAIPNEKGKSYDTVVSELEAIKMVPKRVDAYDNQLPSGFVISTSPKAGTVERPGVLVNVTVSKGRAPITVPNVVGEDYGQASQELTQLGLTVAETQKASTSVPANHVISQSLAENVGAVKGQAIILTVSTGPPQVTVPDVTNQGLSFDQAAAALQQAGLGAVKMFDFPGGQVRNQNPGPGTPVPAGTQVQLWLGP